MSSSPKSSGYAERHAGRGKADPFLERQARREAVPPLKRQARETVPFLERQAAREASKAVAAAQAERKSED